MNTRFAVYMATISLLNASVVFAVEPKPKTELNELGKKCKAGEGSSCEELIDYYHIHPRGRNWELWKEYSIAHCETSGGPSCELLAAQLEKGSPHEDTKGKTLAADPEGARHYYSLAAESYEKSCNEDNESACEFLATLYLKGKGVPRDEVKAASLYRKAVDLGNPQAASTKWKEYCNNG